MTLTTQHLWVVGGHCAADGRSATSWGPDIRVDCHRGLRGPYTGVGGMLRAVVPVAWQDQPDLVGRHRIELLFAAPELERLIGPVPQTLTLASDAEERTRWFSRAWTRRIAHGVVDFLRSWAEARSGPAFVVELDRIDRADPTDQEFATVAVRRLDPARVRLVAHSTSPDLPPQLAAALTRYADRPESSPPRDDPIERDGMVLARAFVWSDGTSERPAEREAYQRLGPDERAALHDARADEVEHSGEVSWRFGAIPYHRARGTDPCGRGAEAIATAQERCLNLGFYDAVVALGRQFDELLDRYPDELAAGHYPALMRLAPAVVDNPEEYQDIQRRVMASTTDAQPLATAHYALAMLHTRLLAEEQRNHLTAKGLINTAIALASAHPDPEYRAFHTVFMQNGLALIEMHRGDLPAALELVTAGQARLDRELPAGRHRLHRSVLRYNRAQLLAALGRLDEALAEFTAVIEVDPNYPEYHFDRGNVLRRLGDAEGAIADYEHAMRLTPPFPELYHNRGDARLACGDQAGAAADFGYVLDLEPDHLESRVSLATLLLDAGDAGAALAQARLGLEHHPADARLWCVVGQASVEAGDLPVAVEALDRALAVDPGLYPALVDRAAVACAQGDPDAAVADLDRALALAGEHPDLLFNRGYALEAAGRHVEAIADYTHALGLPGADTAELHGRLEHCRSALAAST